MSGETQTQWIMTDPESREGRWGLAWVGSGPGLDRGRGACRDRTVMAGVRRAGGEHVIALLARVSTLTF